MSSERRWFHAAPAAWPGVFGGAVSSAPMVVSLMDALGKITWQPAQRFEHYMQAMQLKGRIKVGADADITVFDAGRVIDRATFEKPMQPSAGIICVLVSGIPVVRNAELVADARPGRPIRRAILHQKERSCIQPETWDQWGDGQRRPADPM
jgi:N-acyl-D-aspartate/D-glutamate deacylase